MPKIDLNSNDPVLMDKYKEYQDLFILPNKTPSDNTRLAALQTELADYLITASDWNNISLTGIPYGSTTGAANTYTVTLSPAPTAYVDGMGISVKINVQNTAASSININGLGAKSILRANGSALASGNLKANSIYTLRYNGTAFILQGEGGGGNATNADLRLNKTAVSDAGDLVGTAPDNAAMNSTISTQGGIVNIPQGFHPVGGKVTASFPNLLPGNVKKDINIGGVVGTLQTPIDGSMTIPANSNNIIQFPQNVQTVLGQQLSQTAIAWVSLDNQQMVFNESATSFAVSWPYSNQDQIKYTNQNSSAITVNYRAFF